MATLTMKTLQEEIEELKREIAELKSNRKTANKQLPKGLDVGKTFELAGARWKIIDITDTGYVCLADSIDDMEFDSKSSDWKTSELRKYLNEEFLKMVEAEIGAGNLVEFERNLLSLDGQTEYGLCTDKVSLLTVDEYRKYRKYIPNANKWWWLITPWSTPCNDYSGSVAVVAPSGGINYDNCDGSNGVRPFCIFSSSIFESGD